MKKNAMPKETVVNGEIRKQTTPADDAAPPKDEKRTELSDEILGQVAAGHMRSRPEETFH